MDIEASSYLSPSALKIRLRWDVFLSFRGEDTRHIFTGQLYAALQDVGVRAFIDNEGLIRGDEISPSLIEAIEDSAAAVAIISPRYADSRWCLEELSRIFELRRLVLPVFYRVDPSDVRRQKGLLAFGPIKAQLTEPKPSPSREAASGSPSHLSHERNAEQLLAVRLPRSIA